MIDSLVQIIAQVYDQKKIEKLQGEGVVEKKLDDTTYLLRFSSGTVRVTIESGSIASDTPVKVKQQGDKIILQPVTLQKTPQDQIAFSQNKKDTQVASTSRELLSIIYNTTPAPMETKTKEEYAVLVKKLASVVHQNPQLLQMSKELQSIAQKISASSPQTSVSNEQPTRTDTHALVSTVEQKLVELCCKQQTCIKLPVPVQEGYSYFTSGKEAVEWIARTQPDINKNNLDKLVVPQSEPVIVQTATTTSGESLAIVMNREEGAQILDTLVHSETASPLWGAASADELVSILVNKGSISRESVEAIDKILQFYSSSAQTQESRSSENIKHLVQQWIGLMFDNTNSLNTLATQAPVSSAGEIAVDLEQNIPTPTPERDQLLESIKNVLYEAVKNTDQPKPEIIMQAMDKMGYSLESDLLKSSQPEPTDKKEITETVKAQLLSLLFQNLPGNKPATVTQPTGGVSKQEPVSISQQLQLMDSLVQSLQSVVNQDLEKVTAEIEQAGSERVDKSIQETVQEIKKLFEEFVQKLAEANKQLTEIANAEYLGRPVQEDGANVPQQVTLMQATTPVKFDALDQLLSFLMRSTGTMGKSLEAVKTSITNVPSTDSGNAQQVIASSEKHVAILKDILTQLQGMTKSVPQPNTEIPANKSQTITVAATSSSLSPEDIQKFMNTLRNLTASLEGKPEPPPAETQAKPTPAPLPELLLKQIQSTLHDFLKALEHNSLETIKQLQEITSQVRPEVSTEINKLVSQLTELMRSISETIKNDILPLLVAQHFHTANEVSTVSQTSFTENISPEKIVEIEKLLQALLELLKTNKPEFQNVGQLLKDLASLEVKHLAQSFGDKATDVITRLITQLETLLKSVKDPQLFSSTPLSEQRATIKLIAKNSVMNLFKPLDTLLSTLLTDIKQGQTGQQNSDRIQGLADNLYKAIISTRNSVSSELAFLTQGIIDDIEKGKSVNPVAVNNGVNNLSDLITNLTTNLMSTISQEKLPIGNALYNILQNASTAFSQWNTDAHNVQSGLEQSLSGVIEELKENLTMTFKEQLLSQKDLEGQLHSLITKTMQKSISDTLTQIKQYSSQLSKTFHSPEFTALKNIEQQWQTVLKSLEPAINNLETDFRNLINDAEKKFIQSLQSFQQSEVTQEAVSKNLQSIANRLSMDINRLFDAMVREIMTLLEKASKDSERNPEEVIRQINHAVTQMKHEIDQLIRTLNRQIETFTSRNQRGLSQALPEGMRQQIETALTRFESLQLLAKPTPTAEGQQQILSLPMKFGDEWADVNILLIKKRKKKSGKISGNRFSVRMYVTPSQCGPIAVNMDYSLKHKLNVRIEFENNDSRLWFNKHKEHLIGALKKYDIPSVALSLETASPKKPLKKQTKLLLPRNKGTKESQVDISI